VSVQFGLRDVNEACCWCSCGLIVWVVSRYGGFTPASVSRYGWQQKREPIGRPARVRIVCTVDNEGN